MSQPTSTPMVAPITAPVLSPVPFQSSRFLERLIAFLIPFFLEICPDFEEARQEIIETLASYGARTRAEFLNAAQIIAYSFSALDTLHEAKMSEMTPTMRLRFRGCANNLNRSSQKNEQTLAKRLACDIPQADESMIEPVADIDEAELHEQIQKVHAELAARGIHLPARHPTTSALKALSVNQAKPAWGSAMMQALAEAQTSVQPNAAP